MGFRVIQAADGSKPEEKKGGFRIIQPAAKSGKAAGPVFDPVKDLTRAVRPAWEAVAADVERGGGPDSAARLLGLGAGFLQGITTNQVTGPASRALATYGPRAYERPAAPWDERFGQAPRQLSGDEAAQAIEGDLNSALMGLRAVPGAAKPLPARVAKPLEPDVRAARAIERAQARDRLAGEVSQAAPGAMPIHQGGESLTELADVLTNSPGPGRGVIRRAVRDYEDAAVNRTKGDIARDLGGRDDYFDTLDATMASRALAAEPARQRAFAAPIDPAAFGAEISPLMSRVPKKAIDYAMEIARRDGVNPNDLGIEMVRVPGKPTSETVTEMVKERVPGGGFRDVPKQREVRVEAPLEDTEFIISRPTMKTLHYIKKGIDQELEAYRNAVTGKLEVGNGLGAATAKLRSEYGQALRKANPDYDEFMKIWGDESGHVNALELGRDAFSAKGDMSSELLRRRVNEMNDVERDMFRKGVGEALIAEVRSSKGDVGALRKLLRSEENADRLALAFPDDQAFANFMESAARRVAERDVNSRILGGSPTEARRAARADLEAEGFDYRDAAGDVLTGNVGGAARKAAQAAIKSLPRKSRSVIGDPDANLALARALTDEDEMTRVLNSLNAARARDARLRAAVGRAAPLLVTGDAALREARTAGERGK
ncbi:hypothetical protein GGQ61_000172 [Phenylobacterium haematophilum]|uniref:Uncharacterized protein n=1 Tax=Phenylobacterium haematophilum TaxID=98513 RepID=A0A839ZSV3_9CAUL|nr:hypothetical protein [Phenylobacterium haematophilum]MBB3889475.1 hypothetical protein [Phenylobacterium haematophilum]